MVGSDDDVVHVRPGSTPACSFSLSLVDVPIVGQDFEAWTPLFELHFPVEHDAGGDYHKMWSPFLSENGDVCEKRDGLDGLAKTHLVSEDAVGFRVVQVSQPVESAMLVFT